MQKITRSNVAIIYAKVCNGWQTKIDTILKEQQFNNEIEVSEELIIKAFSEADKDQKKLLEKYFTLPKKITDKIKNFDDILKILGKSMNEILPYKIARNKNEVKINALAKIQAIEEVLNEGWQPNWANSNEAKYYPYFEYKTSSGGWAYYYFFCLYGSSGTEAAYYKNSELAIFAGKTFIKEYTEFIDSK